MTAGNTGMILCLAVNYGGRTEIADAARRLAEDVRDGRLEPAQVDEALFASYLYTAGMSDPDLLIRTAGEMRISNFLLWQISYAELWVTPTPLARLPRGRPACGVPRVRQAGTQVRRPALGYTGSRDRVPVKVYLRSWATMPTSCEHAASMALPPSSTGTVARTCSAPES